ncbi:GNAT family N-acetyltransferase [Ideonella sp.]|uniref:GNAT family N-acetyltransferase n=1 Tax=Ideonella sp. TaxID=1929293 RepID=UPI0035AE1510
MHPDDIRAIVLDTIRTIAPETAACPIPPGAQLRQAIDLDSMDWLNVVAGLEEHLLIEIPPADEARLSTVDAIVDYAAARLAQPSPPRPVSPRAPALPRSEHVINGAPVLVRPIRDDDKALEADFVRHLSSLSRYRRFMATMSELPSAKLEELTHVDQDHHVALVAETTHQGLPQIVGVARYVVDAAGTGCEFAVAIDDAWQGSGLAGILMHKLIATARARGLATMEGLVLRANDKMLKLSRQLGFQHQRDPDDHDTVRVVRSLATQNNT